MKKIGKMVKDVLRTSVKKTATINYPSEKHPMPEGFRGKLKFEPQKCIGCTMCMRDCPSGAITITDLGNKVFQADIDLGKCIYCAQCVDSCMKKALDITGEFELAQLDYNKLKVVLHGEAPKDSEGKACERPKDCPPGDRV